MTSQVQGVDQSVFGNIQLAAARDLPDLRDQFYRPTLSPLRPVRERDDILFYPRKKALRIAIRDQGSTGTCTGQALASLIDIMRLRRANGNALEPASAMMLYRQAKEYELGRNPDRGLLSLRSVIKAFYHYGVCADGRIHAPGQSKAKASYENRHWSFLDEAGQPIDAETIEENLTVARAKSARGVPLGAYYRIAPRLNDYHAALNEAGAILVSAYIHDGWTHKSVAAKTDRKGSGEIDYQAIDPLGAHAFVIIGYNDEGFLVLNSWGETWGGYRDYPGIALWRYGDWADSILDGWILRLGVPTKNAFQFSIGEQGLGTFDGPIEAAGESRRSGSTPCFEILGHFAHLDDGAHVERGAYATSPIAVKETISYLHGTDAKLTDAKTMAKLSAANGERALLAKKPGARKGYSGVLLWIGGSLESMKDAVTLAVGRKDRVKAEQLYPYSIFWCSDFVEQTSRVLARMFDDVVERIGPTSPDLDNVIESACRGVGRAFWRDIETGARKANFPGSHGAEILDGILGLKRLSVHVIVDGAGAVFLSEYLKRVYAVEDERAAFPDRIRSIDFITPAIRLISAEKEAHWRRFFDGFDTSDTDRRARIWLPSAETEDRMQVDVYSKSILHLVANAFEEPLKKPNNRRGLRGPALLGMAKETSGLKRGSVANLEIRTIPTDSHKSGPLSHQQLTESPDLFKAILEDIALQTRGARAARGS